MTLASGTKAPAPPKVSPYLYAFTWRESKNHIVNCCGMGEITELGSRDVNWSQCPDADKRAILERIVRSTGTSYVLASTITSEGWETVNRALEVLGFTQLSTFYNHNSENTVILWGRDMNEYLNEDEDDDYGDDY